jgi:tripartite-type tricarboxylate transporter receptor subunit TctC
MKRLFGTGFVLVISVCFFLSGAEAAYPERQINLLVGLAPGGSNDIFARTLAEALKGILPQPVVVVNKTGGSASIATSEVVHSRPDGYNLLTMYSPAATILPHTNPNLPYKGPGNLQFVSPMGTIPIVLGSRSNAPWKTLQEMIEYARKNPGKVKLGHTGIGSLAHLAGEDLNQVAKVDIGHGHPGRPCGSGHDQPDPPARGPSGRHDAGPGHLHRKAFCGVSGRTYLAGARI